MREEMKKAYVLVRTCTYYIKDGVSTKENRERKKTREVEK